MILDPSPDGRWMHGLSESPFYVKRDHAQPFGEMKVLTHFFHCLREKEQIEKKCNQTVKILNQKNNNRTEREKNFIQTMKLQTERWRYSLVSRIFLPHIAHTPRLYAHC